MTIKAFSVKLTIICAFKHLLDCEWFIPGNLSGQRYPFDAQSSPYFALVLHRYFWQCHQFWIRQLGSALRSKSLSSPPPVGTKQQGILCMVFCSSSLASGLPIQVYKNLTVFTCAFLVEGMPVSKVSSYHRAQLGLGGVNSTSLLVWLFWAETVLSTARLTN